MSEDNGKKDVQQTVKKKTPVKRETVNENFWQLLSAVQSGDLYRSTKAVEAGGGVLVSVSTERKNKDGTVALAESLTYIHDARLEMAYDRPRIMKGG